MLSGICTQVSCGQRVMGELQRRGSVACLYSVAISALLIVAAGPAAADQQQPALARARQLYNVGQYATSIKAAEEARLLPALQDQADLLVGRARLELYRAGQKSDDLVRAQTALKSVRPQQLTPRERVELVIGYGEALYFDNRYLAAVSMFDSALAQSELLGPASRERLFEWWATAMDREAQARSPETRLGVYVDLISRCEGELARDAGASSAAYWRAASLRGAGDTEEAWEAVLAAWVRAPLNQQQASALRADLDRLMLEGIIPDRARLEAGPEGVEQAAGALRGEWERFRQGWLLK